MTLRNLKSFFRLRASSQTLVSEEDCMLADLDKRDAQEPDWDLDTRVASALLALRRGISVEAVLRSYGPEVAKVLARLPQYSRGQDS